MGTRSDVGVALHADIAEDFISSLSKFHWYDIGEYLKSTSEEGHRLYVFENVKWYEGYDDVDEFMTKLQSYPSRTYLFVKVHFDYPLSENELGGFFHNPFNLQKNLMVELYWEGQDA